MLALSMKLQGIFPPITTPFDHTGALYETKVRHNIEKYNRAALSGYVVCGSTGESVFLSTEEKLRLWKWVAESSASGRILISGTGAESVQETVDLTNRTADMGYAAALVRTPSYYKSLMKCDATQELFFRAVADQARIPILIYNIPQFSGIEISASTVAALSHHPNIVGIKDSSGNVDRVAAMVRDSKPGFQVLVGAASKLVASFAAGAAGAIVAFACVAPYATICIWEAHRTREIDAAQDWQQRITHAAELTTTKYGIPGLKHAMDLNGYYGGPPRLPLTVVTPEARQEIEQAFEGIKG
jgi:4-hydroxy-2-oxoglutarate aldolase